MGEVQREGKFASKVSTKYPRAKNKQRVTFLGTVILTFGKSGGACVHPDVLKSTQMFRFLFQRLPQLTRKL